MSTVTDKHDDKYDNILLTPSVSMGKARGKETRSNDRRSLLEMTNVDYMDGLDLSNKDVKENVRHVMNGLLEKTINIPLETRPSPTMNPLVSIEKRHRRVKEKKAKRELKQKEAVKEQKIKEEIQRKAKEMVKKEEESRLRKEKQEEAAIKVHVVAIKRQMNQQKERER